MPSTQFPAMSEPTAASHFDALSAVDDRRCAQRLAMSMPVSLLGMGGDEIGAGEARDISEGGMHLHTARAMALSVGDRCAVNCLPDDHQSKLSSLVDQPLYATVVRTEHAPDGRADMVGLGLRFDQPLFI